jgi:copper chaperone NosL
VARTLAGLALAAVLAACGRSKPGQPPVVRLGRDACARCGMVVSEARFGGGWVEDDGRSVVFDDDSELLAALAERPRAKDAAYVRDAGDGRWLRFSAAVLIRIDGLPTPMGSGYAAFADAAEADSFRRGLARRQGR